MAYKTVQNEWGDWVLDPTSQTTKPWEQPQAPVIDTGYTSGNYSPQSFTGAMGGNAYAAQPALNKYEKPPTQPFDLGKTISDWTKSIKMPWDTQSGQPQQKSYSPWDTQPVGAGEIKPAWETEPTGPYQVPTPGWKSPEKITPNEWEATPFKQFPGYGTNEGYIESPQEVMKALLGKDKKTDEWVISDEDATNYLQKRINNATNEQNLINAVDTSLQRGLKPLSIPAQKLDLIQNEGYMGTMWNYGYKIPKVIEGATNEIRQISTIHSGRVNIDMSKLGQVEYNSLVNVLGELDALTTDKRWAEIDDKDMNVTIKYTKVGSDAFGKATYRADLDIVPAYKTTAQKEAESKAKQKANQAEADAEATAKYWSPEEVADRNKRRQESADWSDAQAQQGWDSFYKIFETKQMPQPMDEYFNRPEMFNDLRRQWKTKGGTWEQFLNSYDFKGQFGKLSASQRGERPAVFAPRMRSTS